MKMIGSIEAKAVYDGDIKRIHLFQLQTWTVPQKVSEYKDVNDSINYSGEFETVIRLTYVGQEYGHYVGWFAGGG